MERMDIAPAWIVLLFIALGAAVLAFALFRRLLHVRQRLREISEILDDIVQGNANHRILADPHDMTAAISYKMNDIVLHFQEQIIALNKTAETNKQLMTSFSHDVRTPLTTLIGYLDAVHKHIVEGREREEYLETARRKAHDLKDYVDKLFEWSKLNSDEETIAIRTVDICELTRMILKDWIPIFETRSLSFDIDIPEKKLAAHLDTNAYSRILNNLIQNVLAHSQATAIAVGVSIEDHRIVISVMDNGIGISNEDLPHIFQRLYKCDKGRSKKDSGLGLSIVQQLTEKMRGTINVESSPLKRTVFQVQFPLVSENPG
ncbi:sensor histidine kinase [Paenibacillus macerans]|nr:sensor histidine kinase [Paenibacillus macerans]GBK72532.1 sensor histidine kinase [Paenibacillus macerans]